MCNVVADAERGTARFAFAGLTVYSACGKTGTAQSGRIEPHAWFVAYAPADNPQVAVAVVIENSREGSEVAAPITRRILDYYFNAPVAPYFDWWTQSYVELNVPTGGTAGG
jgi:cell division protein FtsI/penicillin-binding protein 2